MFLFKLHAPRNVIVGGGILCLRELAAVLACLGGVQGSETVLTQGGKCAPASPATDTRTQAIIATSRLGAAF